MTRNRTKETHKTQFQSSTSLLDNVNHLTGKLDFTATNDYMFRAIMQSSEEARNGLLSALLNIPISDITSTEVLNPIILGEAITEKTIVLDIRILLNDNQVINLEMQVAKQSDWIERTLFYTCKNFIKLKEGRPYKDLLPFIHIGILDFSPFIDNTQLYSEYLFIEKNLHQIYSDKISIRMLNLTQIENVTEDERHSDLYKWVQLFKATTWEELAMVSKDDSKISKFVQMMHEMNDDPQIWEQCLAREMYERDRASNIANGIEQGHIQMATLNLKLIEANRSDDFLRACSDPKYLQQLLEEFRLLE